MFCEKKNYSPNVTAEPFLLSHKQSQPVSGIQAVCETVTFVRYDQSTHLQKRDTKHPCFALVVHLTGRYSGSRRLQTNKISTQCKAKDYDKRMDFDQSIFVHALLSTDAKKMRLIQSTDLDSFRLSLLHARMVLILSKAKA